MSNEKKPERRGLGRGLSALMADVSLSPQAEPKSESAVTAPSDRKIPIELIHPNPDQPRRVFSPEQLESLAASIREKGVLQPLIVREDPSDPTQFQIVAGERRWRASQIAQLHELPVLVRDLNDTEALEIAIIENIQRADLNPVEEAQGFQQLMERFGHTQEKLAQALGKSRSHIANMLRLLSLPEPVLEFLSSGALSTGHARALITADDPTGLAKRVIAEGLSVRDTEKFAKGAGSTEGRKSSASRPKPEKDADTRALELDLSAALGMTVSIDHRDGQGGGTVSIKYGSLDALDDLCQRLSS